MSQQHNLFVCVTCASAHRTKQAIRISGGDRLLERLRNLAQDWPLQDEFAISPVDCFGVCNQDCAIALSAPGKNTYLLANLPVDSEQLGAVSSAILEYAGKYHSAADGIVKHMQCPNLLKQKALVRIPPLPEATTST